MNIIKKGDRVRLLRDIDRYPHFKVAAGAEGVVIDATVSFVAVKMDVVIPGCEEWNNEVHWQDDPGTMDELGDDVEVVQ